MKSLGARGGLNARIRAASQFRDTTRPLIWFHAPSVGEGLQARPVIESIRCSNPETQIAYTFFSPSAEKFAHALDVDFADFLPFDTARNARLLLDALRPDVLVYSKLDVWPLLTGEASARGIPVVLISGTVAPRSRRMSPVAKLFLKDAYGTISAAGVIDASNAARLETLGVHADRVTVLGDTRFDQVSARAASVSPESKLLSGLVSERATLVAGSTWGSDEEVLLPAWMEVIETLNARDAHTHTRPRLIIAPHEPRASNISTIADWSARCGLSCATLGSATGETDVVIVDRVGVLGELYWLGDAAYVGGGFHAAGLHSVIEPAAFGIPVFFGPRNDMSREAGLLKDSGGGFAVADSKALARKLGSLFTDEVALADAGRSASRVVTANLGATGRAAAMVLSLLNR